MNHTIYSVTREEIGKILDAIKDKTLGEVDRNNVFSVTDSNPKITGIAGIVIEKSVLGYPPNSSRDADLLIDNVPVELKTIGIRYTKENPNAFEAKEPMTITAVSLPKDRSEPPILKETFYNSHFWKKAEHLLIVLYHYSADSPVPAKEYASFDIKGYIFNEFNEEDRLRLKNDWNIIKNFIYSLYTNSEDPTTEYPRLSSELRHQLVYLDTAPKYPHPPRFRLKRTLVSKIVQEYFSSQAEIHEYLPGYHSFSDFDHNCYEIEQKYSGMTLNEILIGFGIDGATSKNSAEIAVVRMFGGKKEKLNDLEVFASFGLIAKNITLTREGKRTEDTKLFTIDFDEWKNSAPSFENSYAYSYFSDYQFFFIIFEEPSHDAPLGENVFRGFRRYVFSNDFIELEVRKTWEKIGELIINHKLKETPVLDKDGKQIFNKTGIPRMSINFPKSSEGIVFVRGTSTDSRDKPIEVNGIKMYRQQLWIKGCWIAEQITHAPQITTEN